MNSLIQTITKTTSGVASTILRIPVGLILMAHGAQKLFGMFGGYGLEGTGQFMASLGLEPGYLMALLAGSAEFFGGLALVIGLLVRPASAVIAFTMVMAIFSVHISNGLFMANNGYEYALTLLIVAMSLVFSGAGALSVDKALSSKH
ncbi:MAG: DoxX family protein [Marinomonas sp.]|mgnify:CR=1 FL=1|jgi:putative oxidoreductase|uniref:Oxidoreductase n=1 Tax=Marinomonas pontica TaxID=264739 RepID=A0ABM8FCY9_9GAMM|nr:DoxX family protein [Marinomonas pontica]MCW8356319.1 DoxX family protein [Marinomonas pontica]BDX01914.1 oxidoreductase [Marinomonas pontica]